MQHFGHILTIIINLTSETKVFSPPFLVIMSHFSGVQTII